MLFFSVCFSDIDESYGYHEMSLSGKNTFSMNLEKKDKILILFLNKEISYQVNATIKSSNSNKTHILPITDQALQIFDTQIDLWLLKPASTISFGYWIVKTSICKSVSFLMQADYSLTATFLRETNMNFCIFPQKGVRQYSFDAILDSLSNSGSIEIINQKDVSSLQCDLKQRCKFHSHEPYYIHIKDVVEGQYKLDLAYTVDRASIDSVKCEINPILAGSPGGFVQPIIPYSVEHPMCSSSAEQDLLIISLIMSGILIAILILIILHCAGWIDLRAILCCKKFDQGNERFEDLKKVITRGQPGDIGNQSDDENQEELEHHSFERAE